MKIKKREEVEVMGTFAGYTGGMDILEEERDDFTQKILKLLNYSGMMNFEVVNMFGMELLSHGTEGRTDVERMYSNYAGRIERIKR